MPEQNTGAANIFEYLEQEDEEYRSKLFTSAQQLLDQCTPAFRRQIDAPLAVTMPVAAEEESEYLLHTLEQFHLQHDPPPYRLLLYLNFPGAALPEPERMAKVQKNIQATLEYLERRPELPAGLIVGWRDMPLIGQLRKHVTDLALLFSEQKSDVLLLTHDADTLRMHPRYLQNMWQRYQKGLRHGEVLGSRVRHGYSHELASPLHLPNMDRVIAWSDLTVRLTGTPYELGSGLNGSDYLRVGGFDPRLMGAEVVELLMRVKKIKDIDTFAPPFVPGTDIITSPRRLFHKLQAKISPRQFWQPGDMLEAEYRDTSFDKIEDISAIERDTFINQIVSARFDLIVDYLDMSSVRWGEFDYEAAAKERAEYALRIGHTVLQTV